MSLIANLVARFTADTTAFERGTSRARQSMRATQQQTLSLQRSVVRLAAAYIGVRGLTRAISSVTRAGMEQEAAERRLAAALSSTEDATEGNIAAFKRYAAELQKQTIYGDEQILQQIAYAKNLGVTTDKLDEAAVAAVGLAAKYKLDLQAAMMLVGRASQGQTQMLTRYGIVLDETLSDEEKFNALLKIGAENFHLARAETDTAAGSMEQLSNAWGDTKEAIADVFLPSMKTAFETLTVWLEQNQGDFQSWANNVVAAFDYVADHAVKSGQWLAEKVVAPGEITTIARERYRRETGDVEAFTERLPRGPFEGTTAYQIPPKDRAAYERIRRDVEAMFEAERNAPSGYKSLEELRLERIQGEYPLPEANVTATPQPPKVAPGETETGGQDLAKKTVDVAAAYRRMYGDIDRQSAESWAIRKDLLWEEFREYNKVVEDKLLVWDWFQQRQEQLAIEEAKATGGLFEGARASIAELKRELPTIGEVGAQVAETGIKGIVSGLSDAVFESRNLNEALRGVGMTLAKIAFEWAAMRLVTGGLNMLFPSARGNAFGPAGVIPFDRGGIVDRPTLFPFARGIGLMGEKGEEAILPLERDSRGRLGVHAGGGGTGTVEALLSQILSALDRRQVLEATIVDQRQDYRQWAEGREGEQIWRHHAARNRG